MAKSKDKVEGDSVVVKWKGGEREYSRAVHGDNFADLAKEFAEKKGGKVV